MGFFRHLELAAKWLQEHPWTSFTSSIYAAIMALHLERLNTFMDDSTPILKWLSIVVALALAMVTLALKVKELKNGKRKPKV